MAESPAAEGHGAPRHSVTSWRSRQRPGLFSPSALQDADVGSSRLSSAAGCINRALDLRFRRLCSSLRLAKSRTCRHLLRNPQATCRRTTRLWPTSSRQISCAHCRSPAEGRLPCAVRRRRLCSIVARRERIRCGRPGSCCRCRRRPRALLPGCGSNSTRRHRYSGPRSCRPWSRLDHHPRVRLPAKSS